MECAYYFNFLSAVFPSELDERLEYAGFWFRERLEVVQDALKGRSMRYPWLGLDHARLDQADNTFEVVGQCVARR